MFVVGVAFPIRIFTLHIAVFIAQSGPCRPLIVIVDVVGVCSDYTGGMSELVVGEKVDTIEVLRIVAVVVAIDIFRTNLKLVTLAQWTQPVCLERVFCKSLTFCLETACIFERSIDYFCVRILLVRMLRESEPLALPTRLVLVIEPSVPGVMTVAGHPVVVIKSIENIV